MEPEEAEKRRAIRAQRAADRAARYEARIQALRARRGPVPGAPPPATLESAPIPPAADANEAAPERSMPPEAGVGEPDVLLDVPEVEVEEITLEVENLRAGVSLSARVGNLVVLGVGAEADLGHVNLTLKGVRAQAQLTVRLQRVYEILERTLTSIDRNPELLAGLLQPAGEAAEVAGRPSVEETPARSLGQALGATVEKVGESAGATVEKVAESAGAAVEQAAAPLAESAGATVEKVGESAGATVEKVAEAGGATVEKVGEAGGATVEKVGESAGATVEQAAAPLGEAAGAAVENIAEQAGQVVPEGDRRRGARVLRPIARAAHKVAETARDAVGTARLAVRGARAAHKAKHAVHP